MSNWVLGIDGGGTKCLARLETLHGELIGEVVTGPANVAQDAATAYDSVCQACEQLRQRTGISAMDFANIPSVIGLAGFNIQKYAEAALQWSLPVHTANMTTDLHIACAGAHGSETGALIITGTGSSAYVNIGGAQRIIGGHGFPLGDEASGAWLGWRALSFTLQTLDGMHPDNALTQHLCQKFDTQSAQALVAMTLHYQSCDYAALAPEVIALAAQAEPNAISIMQQGAQYLSRILTVIEGYKPPRIAMTGGLAPAWQQWLAPEEANKLRAPLSTPVQGAVLLARTMANNLTHNPHSEE